MNRSRAEAKYGFKTLGNILQDADVLLIVPPFHLLNCPSLSLHLLQACAREAGFRVQVLYANMLLALRIGEEAYANIFHLPVGALAGERFFTRRAFGLPPLGRRARHMNETNWVIGPHKDWRIEPDPFCRGGRKLITLGELRRLEGQAEDFIDSIAKAVTERCYPIVGCSTNFYQTAASVALLNAIKTLRKDTITILGGANCEGEMARGLASLPSAIDYIFSGESELSFPRFVRDILAGLRPPSRILYGKPCRNLDALPTPSYAEFYEQRQYFLPLSQAPPDEILCQTSRGCWWAQKHPCTFCGLNGESLSFRQKSPDRVARELHTLLETCPAKKVNMTDNVMPSTYFQDLLPRLARDFPGVSFSYMQKANLSLAQLLALKEAGINTIGPGIESLSSRLLALMNKGLQARQNLMLLRNARALDMEIAWDLLWGFPGDEVGAYREMLTLLPLLHHLQPPNAMVHLSVERFSPYFSRPADFGLRNLRPLSSYKDLLPKGVDIKSIAYHFTADYRSGAHDHPEVIQELLRELTRWRAAWKHKNGGPIQNLQLVRKRGSYVLVDSRDLWRRKKCYTLQEREATGLMTSRLPSGSGVEKWAIQEKLAVVVDDWFVPLAVPEPEALQELTRKAEPEPIAPEGRALSN